MLHRPVLRPLQVYVSRDGRIRRFLGRTSDGDIVFERIHPRVRCLAQSRKLGRWAHGVSHVHLDVCSAREWDWFMAGAVRLTRLALQRRGIPYLREHRGEVR